MVNAGILVTRPTHQAQHLCQMLTAAGMAAIQFPTLAIAADNRILEQAIHQLATASFAIFVSANAVLHAKTAIHNNWPILPKQLKFIAVGRATAKALLAADLPGAICPENFNSEGILALAELTQLQGQTIIIFQGEGGRGLLYPALTKRGAQVIEAICYQRHCPTVDAASITMLLADRRIKIIISTSIESLENLFLMIPDKTWLKAKFFVFVSERIAKKAYELGIKNYIIANSANDEDIVAACLAASENILRSRIN